jgi:hypothetical protein
MGRRVQAKVVSGLDLLAGLWLIISPFVLGYWDLGQVTKTIESQATNNDLIVGFTIAAIAAIRLANAYRVGGYELPTMWLSWLSALLGLWLIVSPFILGFTGLTTAFWNNIILGIIVAVLGVWNALVARALGGTTSSGD